MLKFLDGRTLREREKEREGQTDIHKNNMQSIQAHTI